MIAVNSAQIPLSRGNENFSSHRRWAVIALSGLSLASAASAAAIIGLILVSNPIPWAIAATAVLGLTALASGAGAYVAAKLPEPVSPPSKLTFSEKLQSFWHTHQKPVLWGAATFTALLATYVAHRYFLVEPPKPPEPSISFSTSLGTAVGLSTFLLRTMQQWQNSRRFKFEENIPKDCAKAGFFADICREDKSLAEITKTATKWEEGYRAKKHPKMLFGSEALLAISSAWLTKTVTNYFFSDSSEEFSKLPPFTSAIRLPILLGLAVWYGKEWCFDLAAKVPISSQTKSALSAPPIQTSSSLYPSAVSSSAAPMYAEHSENFTQATGKLLPKCSYLLGASHISLERFIQGYFENPKQCLEGIRPIMKQRQKVYKELEPFAPEFAKFASELDRHLFAEMEQANLESLYRKAKTLDSKTYAEKFYERGPIAETLSKIRTRWIKLRSRCKDAIRSMNPDNNPFAQLLHQHAANSVRNFYAFLDQMDFVERYIDHLIPQKKK